MRQAQDPAGPDVFRPFTYLGIPVMVDESSDAKPVAIVISREVEEDLIARQVNWSHWLGSITSEELKRIFREGP